MAPKWTSKTGLASAAALLLAGGGLVAYLVGERMGRAGPASATTAPPRAGKDPGRAAGSFPSPVLSTQVPYRGYTVAPSGPFAGDGEPGLEPSATGPDGDAARDLSSAMARLVSDLEWNSNRGLPEPPQQNVAPLPDPWRPPADAGSHPDSVIDQVVPARGTTRGGTRVTLRGRHLRASEVMFGTSPASIVASSDKEITVLSPASPPGPVSIAVTNPDGSFAIAGTAFTYAD